MVKIPLATFERVLKESRRGIRVSEEASREFIEVIGEISKDIALEASELAVHANRKTILRSDIKLASKRFRK